MKSQIQELETKMMQLEEELAYFRQISNYSNEWTIIWSEDCKPLFVSPSCEHITGYSSSEFFSNPDLLMNIVKEEDKSKTKHFLSPFSIDSHNVLMSEFRISTKCGDVKWIAINCYKKTEPGVCECTISVYRDITSLKEIEATLRFSDEKFRKAFHHNPCMIGLSDLETSAYVEVNQSFLDQLGFSSDEVIGKKASDLFSEYGEHREAIIKKMKDQGGYLHNEETIINRKSGDTILVSFSAEVMEINDKSLMLTSAFDITAFRNAQDEILYINGLMEILMSIATKYINLPYNMFNKGINEALSLVGEFVKADRAFVFAYNHENHTTSCTHEWCRDGIEPQIDLFQQIPIDKLPDYNFHKYGKIFHVPDSGVVSEESLKSFFISMGVKTIITIPLFHDGVCFGYIGFDSVNTNHSYSEKEMLIFELFAQILLSIHMREHDHAEIHVSNERFRTIFEYAPVMIDIFDRDGKCFLWNRHCEEVFGWTYQELKSHHDPLSLFYTDPAELQAVKASTSVYPVGEFIKWHPLTKQGKRLTTLWMNFMLPDGLVINIGLDITKQKQLEHQFSETQQRNKQLIELAHEGIWTIDENSITTYVNPHMAEMFGFTVDEMIGRSMFSHMDENGIAIALANLERCKQGFNEQHDFEFIRKDGKRIFCLMNTSAIFSNTGKYLGALAMVTDITKRKLAESEKQRIIERFSIISEYSRTVYWEVDHNGLFTYLSASVSIVTGYDPEELNGKFHFYDLSPVENRENLISSAFEIFAKRERFDNFENRLQRKDGQIIWVSTSGLPFYDRDGNFSGYRGSDTDITIRKEQQDMIAKALETIREYQLQLQSLNANMIQSEESERKRLADFLHDDLGQLLAITRIKLTMLLASGGLSAHEMTIVDESSGFLNLAISKCREVTYELNPPILHEQGLVEALRWKLDQVNSLFGIETSLTVHHNKIDISDDVKITLFRISGELINNAIKHAKCSRIIVKLVKSRGKITCSVKDNGAGFDVTMQNKPQSNNSYGLFSIAERLKTLNGDLIINSRPGRGTKATVII